MKIKEKVRIEKDRIMEYSKADISAMKKVKKIIDYLLKDERVWNVDFSTKNEGESEMLIASSVLEGMIFFAEKRGDE